MTDMLVKLYNLRLDHGLLDRLEQQQVSIHRALAPDARRIVAFVESGAAVHWPNESKDAWSVQRRWPTIRRRASWPWNGSS